MKHLIVKQVANRHGRLLRIFQNMVIEWIVILVEGLLHVLVLLGVHLLIIHIIIYLFVGGLWIKVIEFAASLEMILTVEPASEFPLARLRQRVSNDSLHRLFMCQSIWNHLMIFFGCFWFVIYTISRYEIYI